ncbi:MAG: GDP-mannose 4,6-dehydratase [Terriglobales bacterium]
MKALVTGCTGFVGSHLVDLLLREGVAVYGIVYQHGKGENVLPDDVHLIEGDISDPALWERTIAEVRPDQVYNLAAVTSVPGSLEAPRKTYDVNVTGLLNLFEAVRQFGLQCRILNISSAQVYGSLPADCEAFHEGGAVNPSTPYAASKIMGEILAASYVKAYGLNVISVRPFNHIGPRQSAEFVCSDFARQMVEVQMGVHPPILFTGNLDAERDFTDVRDVVAAYWSLLRNGRAGEIYNVCSGTVYRLRTIVDRLQSLAGVHIELRTDPARLRTKDNTRLCGNPAKIREATGWLPRIPLDTTLADLLQYWKTKSVADKSAAVLP